MFPRKLILNFVFLALATLAYGGDSSQTLEQFAKACDEAIGVTVPDFDSDNGTEVPTTHFANGRCDRPNVLNGICDPGSRFQVLANTPDAYVVAHARKEGEPLGRYGDIAVIQHNKVNGATCFYQGALDLDHSGKVKAPSKGVGNPPFWMTPSAIANSSFPCIRCHDSGPIIRSPYLTQITGVNKLPGAGDFGFNKDAPYAFVGSDFAHWKAYKVEVSGNICISCHRLGVNNVSSTGTARVLGLTATADMGTPEAQASKNPHSADSPIWMPPRQVTFSQHSFDQAKEIQRCAEQFGENLALPDSPTCKITLFARAFEGARTTPSSFGAILEYLLESQ